MRDLHTRPPAPPGRALRPSAGTPLPCTDAVSDRPSGSRHIFTGDWLADGCACHLYTVGYVGRLVRRWNGWAVFTASPAVAELIVSQHQQMFTRLMAEHARADAHGSDAWLATARQIPFISWLERLIVVDHRLVSDDPTQVEITIPDADGHYPIGWGWTWYEADSRDVHTVHGATSP